MKNSTHRTPDPEPSDPEVKHGLADFWQSSLRSSNQKKKKAPEPDNITIDLIEATGETIYTKLAALFNEYLISTLDRNQRREQAGFRKGFSSCRGPG